jgi:hypothetical protein
VTELDSYRNVSYHLPNCKDDKPNVQDLSVQKYFFVISPTLDLLPAMFAWVQNLVLPFEGFPDTEEQSAQESIQTGVGLTDMNRKLKYQQLPAAFNHSLSFTVLSVS